MFLLIHDRMDADFNRTRSASSRWRGENYDGVEVFEEGGGPPRMRRRRIGEAGDELRDGWKDWLTAEKGRME